MEVPLPWERLLWSCRAPLAPRTRYLLTDFRLVCIDGEQSDELAIEDVGEVHRDQATVDRLLGLSTIIVRPRRGRRPPFVIRHVRRGAHLAALLELLSGEPRVSWDPQSIRAALDWEPRHPAPAYREALVGLGAIAIAVVAVVAGLHGKTTAVVYPPDDAIAPGGVKKDRAAITLYMREEVMPWAQNALAPIVGGADRVRCETCHGKDPESRDWQMPAVAALPQPDVSMRGWETYGGTMDAQMRNAIYGYTAESDKLAKAAYMREVVMPGMARLLHRPPYDFTRPYDYNRSRMAFGCYHCHRVQ
jgi:hypothetical protein